MLLPWEEYFVMALAVGFGFYLGKSLIGHLNEAIRFGKNLIHAKWWEFRNPELAEAAAKQADERNKRLLGLSIEEDPKEEVTKHVNGTYA